MLLVANLMKTFIALLNDAISVWNVLCGISSRVQFVGFNLKNNPSLSASLPLTLVWWIGWIQLKKWDIFAIGAHFYSSCIKSNKQRCYFIFQDSKQASRIPQVFGRRTKHSSPWSWTSSIFIKLVTLEWDSPTHHDDQRMLCENTLKDGVFVRLWICFAARQRFVHGYSREQSFCGGFLRCVWLAFESALSIGRV